MSQGRRNALNRLSCSHTSIHRGRRKRRRWCARWDTHDKNEDHADEKLGLLGGGANTSITNNPDGHASSKTRKTASKAGTEVAESGEKSVLGNDGVGAGGLLDCERGIHVRRGASDDALLCIGDLCGEESSRIPTSMSVCHVERMHGRSPAQTKTIAAPSSEVPHIGLFCTSSDHHPGSFPSFPLPPTVSSLLLCQVVEG